MGDQWAVDSANSRAALQIHRKRHGRRTHTSHAGTWKRVGVHGSTKRMQQIQVRKACKCNYSARGFSESEQEQILVNLLSNPLCFRLRDDFTAPLRAPLCRIQPPLCLCPRWRFTSIIRVVRLLQRVEINRLQFWLIWCSDCVVSRSTKTKGVGDKYRLQKLAGEPRTQLPNVNKVWNKLLDWWLLHLNTSRWLQPFCRNRRTLYFPFQPRFDVATATDANWWPRHWPGVSLDFHDWSVWHFVSGFWSVDWRQSKL